MNDFKVKVELEVNVTQEDIDDIVTTALEGGINDRLADWLSYGR